MYGDFPYYHVSQSIYDALNNGSLPSLLNPFITTKLAKAEILSLKPKSAWGRTGDYSATLSRVVNFQSGTSSGGSYYGDVGFSFAPSVIMYPWKVEMPSSVGHGFNVGITGLTNISMSIDAIRVNMNLYGVNWLVIGR
jgi:hypothetical protein